MKRRSMIMDDPQLDRIFTEVYRDTMEHAEQIEREKRLEDHANAFVELFERELESRDLSPIEREALVAALDRRLAEADRLKEERRSNRIRRQKQTAASAAAIVVVGVLVALLVFRPLKPLDDVKIELDTYITGVDSGVAGYADDFYKLLNRYDHRLGDSLEQEYRQRMHEILDRKFEEILSDLVSGNLVLFNDARDWANRFPDRAERQARRRIVENASVQGVGGAVRNLFDGLKRAGEEAVEWVESVIEEKNSDAEGAPASEPSGDR